MNQLSNEKIYDLEDRTYNLSRTIVQFVKTIHINTVNENIIKQLLKAGTSVGANYREANGAESKRDFCHKIAICKKESKETKYWLKLLFDANPEKELEGKNILKEIKELILIFSKIHKSSQ